MISRVGNEMLSASHSHGAFPRDGFCQLQRSGNYLVPATWDDFGEEPYFIRFLGGEEPSCICQFANKRVVPSYLREERECPHIRCEPDINLL